MNINSTRPTDFFDSLKEAARRAASLTLILIFVLDVFLTLSEEKGDTPERSQTYHRVDDTVYERHLTAEDPSYDIKSEQADASPVDCSDSN